jgi:hypothetical protein
VLTAGAAAGFAGVDAATAETAVAAMAAATGASASAKRVAADAERRERSESKNDDDDERIERERRSMGKIADTLIAAARAHQHKYEARPSAKSRRYSPIASGARRSRRRVDVCPQRA